MVARCQLFAYAIGHMDGAGGYGAWRWVFIIEGLSTVVVAVFAFFMLPDWPDQCKYLSDSERTMLLQKLARDTHEYVEQKSTWQVFQDCFRNPKVYLRYAATVSRGAVWGTRLTADNAIIYFGNAVTTAAASFFLPTILVEGAVHDDPRVHRRPRHHGRGRRALGSHQSPHVSVAVRYMALFFINCGCFASLTVSISWLSNNIVGKKRRGISIAIKLAFGNCGSILGSNIYLKNETPLYRSGYAVSLAMIVVALTSATVYFLYVWHENTAKAKGKRNHLLALPRAERDTLGDEHPEYRYTYGGEFGVRVGGER